MKTTVKIIALILAIATAAQADDRRRSSCRAEPNWILRRQESYQVQGVPTSRLIIGKRQIDIYPNGLMFEKGNVVGIRSR